MSRDHLINFYPHSRNFDINCVIIFMKKEGGKYLIILAREIPYRLLQLEALARWMQKNHSQFTQLLDEIGSRRAGLYGEQQLDYHLKLAPEEKYHIFQGVRLIGKFGAFQIDCLILSPYFILAIEVKNYSDEVHFDKSFNQVIRKSRNRGEENFEDPIAQAHKHGLQLKYYLRDHKIKTPPIETLVCISNASTKITTDDESARVKEKVFHAEHILEKLYEFEKKHSEQIVTPKTLQKLSNCILSGHTPLKGDVFKTYDVSKKRIVKGVQCTKCFANLMLYKSGYWYCTECRHRSQDAHEQSIFDYLLLINPTITNKECCELLGLPSRNISYKILSKMNLSNSGTSKDRKYFLPKEFFYAK
jgi:hypothetical protein